MSMKQHAEDKLVGEMTDCTNVWRRWLEILSSNKTDMTKSIKAAFP